MKKFIITKKFCVTSMTRCDENCEDCPLQGFKFCDDIPLGSSIVDVIDDVKKANDFIKNLKIEEVENE